ncbi:thiamine biosynthesis protein ThiC [Streptomyces sp. NPDC050509]|uniref:thiamine biosynthesis protein ThiC n=1 Tax=Streptomyces sp. NPDC050509 TaxID=3365620 RepID=UPI00379670F9
MKISQDIRRRHGGEMAGGEMAGGAGTGGADGAGVPADEIEAGMAEKSKEFAASGNRVYLPLVD